MTLKQRFNKYVLHNGSYKLVALFVSLVLWVTLLGRADLVLSHKMELKFSMIPSRAITNRVYKNVQVKISGPRSGLKRFTENERLIFLNLEKLPLGKSRVLINKESLNLPVGVKVISIKPPSIKIIIEEIKNKRKN